MLAATLGLGVGVGATLGVQKFFSAYRSSEKAVPSVKVSDATDGSDRSFVYLGEEKTDEKQKV